MRIRGDKTGYMMWLSRRDTYDWAHRPNKRWPCSTLSDKAVMVYVDRNGLCDLTVNGRGAPDSIDGSELDALVSDYLPPAFQHLWPTWRL